MTLPFTPDEFFDVLADYNARLWPFVLMLWLVTVYAVVMLTRARPVRPWFIPGLLAFHWAWSGLAYHAAFFSKINPAAWMFAGLFVASRDSKAAQLCGASPALRAVSLCRRQRTSGTRSRPSSFPNSPGG